MRRQGGDNLGVEHLLLHPFRFNIELDLHKAEQSKQASWYCIKINLQLSYPQAYKAKFILKFLLLLTKEKKKEET